MTTRLQQAAESRANMDNMLDAITHIEWTIEHSPKTYAMFRLRCISLRQSLVNAELRHRELNTGEQDVVGSTE
jgi:hypothetical protein